MSYQGGQCYNNSPVRPRMTLGEAGVGHYEALALLTEMGIPYERSSSGHILMHGYIFLMWGIDCTRRNLMLSWRQMAEEHEQRTRRGGVDGASGGTGTDHTANQLEDDRVSDGQDQPA